MKKPLLFGKYLLLERINVGGMAEVFIAKSFGVEGFEKILAIKKILPTMAEDEEFITMFVDEARISVQLNHANIAHILDFGKYDENYFIAMEYVAGRDLRAVLERFRRRKEVMPTPQAVFIASKMCEGLDYAHRKKDARGNDLHIIHRDVSPQNVIVSYEGEVKLIDFGIAKAANRSQKTQAGILKGKFGYMSPEQVRGFEIDRRSDIFAVGVILYELLTGEKLFVGESDFSTLERVRNAEVPLPRRFNPDIPSGLEKIVLRSLAREPEDRYQWASDLQEDLMRYLLAGDQIFSSKHLSAFMKTAFADDMLREAERMEWFSRVERPEPSDAEGLDLFPPRPTPRRVSSASETPAGGARPPTVPGYALRPSTPIPLRAPSSPPSETKILEEGAEGTGDEEAFQPRRRSISAKIVIGDDAHAHGGATAIAQTSADEAEDAGATRRLPPGGEGEDPSAAPEPTRASSAPRPQPTARPDRPDPEDLAALRGRGAGAKKWAILGGAGAAVALAIVVALFAIPGDGDPAPEETPTKVASVTPPLTAPAPVPQPPQAPPPPPPAADPPPQPKTFTARFEARTPDVEIRLGDRVLGRTPSARAEGLEVGRTYRFTAHKPGYAPYAGEFTAQASGDLAVAVALVEEPKPTPPSTERPRRQNGTTVPAVARRRAVTGGLACSTRPAGAEVWVDGRATGRVTPVALGNPVQIPVGNRVVQFKMNGKKSAPRMVEIKEGEVARLVNIPLE